MNVTHDNIERRFTRLYTAMTYGCWIWIGTKTYHGYGKFRVGDKTMVSHRVAWYLKTGHWPTKDEVVYQTCGNKDCVNPAHLKLVPQDSRDLQAIAERLAQPAKKSGYGQRKDPTKCKRGLHDWVPENIRIINRSPSCVECNRDGNRMRSEQRRLKRQGVNA